MRTTQEERILEFKARVRSRLFGALPGLLGDLSGSELEELRQYEPGDPPSAINHAASQVANTLLVSIRRPDRDLKIVFLIDTTRSMGVFGQGSEKCIQQQALIELGAEAAIAYHARIAACVAERQGSETLFVEYALPSASREQCMKKFTELSASIAGKDPEDFDLRRAFSFLKKEGMGRTLFVVVISDFFFAADYEEELKKLLRVGHVVVAAVTLDPAELTLPALSFGALRIKDSETEKTALIAPSPDSHLDAHRALWKNSRSKFVVLTRKGEQ